jgi:hypothetical protein
MSKENYWEELTDKDILSMSSKLLHDLSEISPEEFLIKEDYYLGENMSYWVGFLSTSLLSIMYEREGSSNLPLKEYN